jgi:hypothetical protein
MSQAELSVETNYHQIECPRTKLSHWVHPKPEMFSPVASYLTHVFLTYVYLNCTRVNQVGYLNVSVVVVVAAAAAAAADAAAAVVVVVVAVAAAGVVVVSAAGVVVVVVFVVVVAAAAAAAVVVAAVAAANFKLLNICKFRASPSTVYGYGAQSFKENIFVGNIKK